MLTADNWPDTALSDLAQPDKQMIASIQAKSNVLFFISHLSFFPNARFNIFQVFL